MVSLFLCLSLIDLFYYRAVATSASAFTCRAGTFLSLVESGDGF